MSWLDTMGDPQRRDHGNRVARWEVCVWEVKLTWFKAWFYLCDVGLNSLKLRSLTYKMVITTLSLKTYVNYAVINGSYY